MKAKSIESVLKKLVPKRYYSKFVADNLMSPYDSVLTGPFQGMKYISASVGSKLYPKIQGIYEKELQNLIVDILALKYQSLINVGAAEGYFAVGFALKDQGINVLAYEMDETGRQKIQELSSLNGVSDRITIKGECTLNEMKEQVMPADLIVMDVEGAEEILLDPINCSQLYDCDILVEMHENRVPGVESKIRERFSETHHIEEYEAQSRGEKDLVIPVKLTADQSLINAVTFGNFRKKVIKRLVDEYRPSQIKWFWMRRKSAIS